MMPLTAAKFDNLRNPMRKLLVVVAALALVIWVISWFRAPEAVSRAAAAPWPDGMGTLDEAAARWPSRPANEAALKLAELARALPRSESVDEYVAREVARAETSIGQPPAVADVSAIRVLLLREDAVWERVAGIGGDDATSTLRALQMTMARALVASALAKARAGDRAAWDDLHAVWRLARTLDGHPQLMVQTAALSMVRMVNGVAWKMPLPAPAWLAEFHAHDRVLPLLEAFQYSVASYRDDGQQLFPTKFLAESVEHDRLLAEEIFKTTQCDVSARSNKIGVDIATVWRRAFRYRAEREASANALRIRAGNPVESASRCSDGSWSFDGTTLRFSREIATPPPDRPMPLVIRVKP